MTTRQPRLRCCWCCCFDGGDDDAASLWQAVLPLHQDCRVHEACWDRACVFPMSSSGKALKMGSATSDLIFTHSSLRLCLVFGDPAQTLKWAASSRFKSMLRAVVFKMSFSNICSRVRHAAGKKPPRTRHARAAGSESAGRRSKFERR